MTHAFIAPLIEALAAHGFKQVDAPNADLLMKRKTFNTNRAVVVVSAASVPHDFGVFVRDVRDDVARRCGYIPFFYPIGIQFVVVVPGITSSDIDPQKYVALVDNQWALIQSVFLVDPERRDYRSGRTWAQFITGKFQDAIERVLKEHFPP